MAAVAISYERWELALIELGGTIVSRSATPHSGDWPQVRRAIRRRLGAGEWAAGGRIAAVCASVPGTVSGLRLVQAPNLGWEDIDLEQLVPRASLPRLRTVLAGEFGHMPFGPPRTQLPRCLGLLEHRAGWSRTGVRARAAGVRRAARILGDGTAALVNALDPELVCLGGLAPELRAAAPSSCRPVTAAA